MPREVCWNQNSAADFWHSDAVFREKGKFWTVFFYKGGSSSQDRFGSGLMRKLAVNFSLSCIRSFPQAETVQALRSKYNSVKRVFPCRWGGWLSIEHWRRGQCVIGMTYALAKPRDLAFRRCNYNFSMFLHSFCTVHSHDGWTDTGVTTSEYIFQIHWRLTVISQKLTFYWSPVHQACLVLSIASTPLKLELHSEM